MAADYLSPELTGDDEALDAEWAERGQYWEQRGTRPTKARRSGRGAVIDHSPLVLTGHGVRLRIDHGALLVHDGFTHYPQKRREYRLFPGDQNLPSRIVLVDTDGSITFDVITWLRRQSIPLVLVNWQGEVEGSFGDSGMATNQNLRQAQMVARNNGVGLKLSTRLIWEKVGASMATLLALPESSGRKIALVKLEGTLRDLEGVVETTDALRLLEAKAAVAYFTCWQTLPLKWRGIGQHPIPTEWHSIGIRQSARGGYNRNAKHPMNAMLNYAYGVLEGQVRVATVVAGLDPAIGYLHTPSLNRASLVYDLMEPLRPWVDRLLLDFATSNTFSPGDFLVTDKGVCRIHPQLARRVAGLAVTDQQVQEVVSSAAVELATTARRVDIEELAPPQLRVQIKPTDKALAAPVSAAPSSRNYEGRPQSTSLENMAAIAAALQDNPGLNGAELARRLGLSHGTIASIVKRLRLAGGWYTELNWDTCAHCGQPMAVPANARRPKKVHPGCKAAWDWRLENEKLATRTPEAVEAKRSRQREVKRAWKKQRWAALSPEEKKAEGQRSMRDFRRNQAITKEQATKVDVPWTPEEDRYLLEHQGEPLRDVALALGRTLMSVRGRKGRLRRELGTKL